LDLENQKIAAFGSSYRGKHHPYVGAAGGCDLLILLLIHNVSKRQKKPPKQAAKREEQLLVQRMSRVFASTTGE
jgi:hypothetical protein